MDNVHRPLPTRPLFGRENDVRELVDLLEPGRPALVTITGRGGVGKTAVAAEVVRALQHRNGTTWVPLAGVTEPGLVVSEIATALGIPIQPDAYVADAVVSALKHDDRLVVLDNAEHLLAAARFVGDLAERIPGLRLLVTSQAPLRLRSEQVVLLEPLPVPPAAGSMPLDQLATQPAVALYCHKAAAVDRRFALSEQNAPVVAELCRRLGGLPLAIELAAARVAVLPASEILRHLERSGIDVLRRERGDTPVRHHDLRAAMDWTYALLTPDEQRALRHLATISGTFDIEAVLALAPADQDEVAADPDSLDQLSSLVDFHLVDPLRDVDPPRFVIPDSIRTYARSELDRLGDTAAIGHRRIALRSRQARSVAEGTESGHSECRSAAIEGDRDDLLDSLSAALLTGLADDALDIARGLGGHWDARGYGSFQERLLERAIQLGERNGCDPARLANAMLWSSYLGLRHTSDHPQQLLVDRIRSAEQLALAADDIGARFHAQCVWMLVSPVTGEFDRAAVAAEEALRLAECAGNEQWRSVVQVWGGMLAHQMGDESRAVELGLAALSTGRRTGDAETVLRASLLLRPMADRFPDDIRGLPTTEESLASAREMGLPVYEALLSVQLVQELVRSGDTPAAVRRMAATLDLVRTMPSSPVVGFALIAVASTAHACSDDDRAAFFHGTVTTQMPALEPFIGEPQRARHRLMVDAIASGLGEDRFAAEVEAGTTVDWREAVAMATSYVTGLLEALIEPVPPADQLAGWSAGHLTARQTEVLRLLAAGLSNKEIAAELGIRAKTVMHHTTAIYRQLGVRGRSEATAAAFRSGIAD